MDGGRDGWREGGREFSFCLLLLAVIHLRSVCVHKKAQTCMLLAFVFLTFSSVTECVCLCMNSSSCGPRAVLVCGSGVMRRASHISSNVSVYWN